MAMNLTTQASLLDTIKDIMSYRGSKTTYQEIEDLVDMVIGDVWECSEVGKEGFYIYDGTTWKLLGSGGESSTNIISTTDPSGKDYEEGTLWINTSYIEDVNTPGSFLQIPEIWIRVKDGWWGLHREGLIKDV